MRVAESIRESIRFGYRIARGEADDLSTLEDVLREISGFDIAIVRSQAELVRLPSIFAQLGRHITITADHLTHWAWEPARFVKISLPLDLMTSQEVFSPALETLTKDVFKDYPNHYAANPLLDPDAALDGYCEWIRDLIGTDRATSLCVRTASDELVAFAVVDWSEPVPDIKLAGVSPSAQGQGVYQHLLRAVMSEVGVRTGSPLRISTQTSNIRVQRTWARLGLLPISTYATHHIIRAELLEHLHQNL